MRATDFFARLSATILVIGLAILAAEYAAGAPEENIKITGVVAGAILGFFVVLTIICGIWEAD